MSTLGRLKHIYFFIRRTNLSQPRKIRIYLYQTLLEVMRLETCLNDENTGPQGYSHANLTIPSSHQ